jgi:hypothetical protein
MSFSKAVSGGNYSVLLTGLCGALGIAYGLFLVGISDPNQTLIAGIVWGVIGLLSGAIISTLINARLWAIPVVLALAFLISHFNMIRH